MIKQLIQAFKTSIDQQKAQIKLNHYLSKYNYPDYVKVSIPKHFIDMICVLAAWGMNDAGQLTRIMIFHNGSQIPIGFPTHSKDITGKTIRVGDKVVYNFKGESNGYFIVVFENNAFRKAYPAWDQENEKPLLEYGKQAEAMKLKIV